MIGLYFIIALIVASLALYSFIKNNNNSNYKSDAGDIILFTFGSIMIGLFWMITIWVALVKWAADGGTPYWFKPIKNVYHFMEEKWTEK